MQEYHVHIYQVTAKAEVNVMAETEEEAMGRAHELHREGAFKVDMVPKTEFLAIIPEGK